MPYWPLPMGLCALLLVWGIGVGAWRVPAVALTAYVVVRLWVTRADPATHEIGIAMIWIAACLVLYKLHFYIPATAFLLSAATYPALYILGFRLEYLGLMAVIAELFAIVALLSIGGGLGTLTFNHSSDSRHSGIIHNLAHYSLGIQARQAGNR